MFSKSRVGPRADLGHLHNTYSRSNVCKQKRETPHKTLLHELDLSGSERLKAKGKAGAPSTEMLSEVVP